MSAQNLSPVQQVALFQFKQMVRDCDEATCIGTLAASGWDADLAVLQHVTNLSDGSERSSGSEDRTSSPYSSYSPTNSEPSVTEIRRLQDQAYQESLAADLAKFSKIKEEKEVKRVEEEKKKMELEEEERKEQKEAERRRKVTQELPEEPEAGEEGVVVVKFRLPKGEMIERRFRPTDPLRTMTRFMDTKGYSKEKFKLLNADRKDFRDLFKPRQTFLEANWKGRQLINVQEI